MFSYLVTHWADGAWQKTRVRLASPMCNGTYKLPNGKNRSHLEDQLAEIGFVPVGSWLIEPISD